MGGMYGRCDLSLAWPTCETGGMGLKVPRHSPNGIGLRQPGGDEAADPRHSGGVRGRGAARQVRAERRPERTPSTTSWIRPKRGIGSSRSCCFNQRAVRTQKKHYIDTW